MPAELNQTAPVSVENAEPSFLQNVSVENPPGTAAATGGGVFGWLSKPVNLLIVAAIIAAAIYWFNTRKKG